MNKYGARKTTIDGITFDSAAEARRYQELRLLEAAGEIERLTLQPTFLLQASFKDKWSGKRERAIHYIGDFMYIENGRYVVEDAKGVQTQVFRVKWKLVKAQCPDIEFRIVKA